MKEFLLTEDHIELISKFYINEGCAEACPPEVNQKRPWGNSDYIDDMAEILGVTVLDEEEYDERRYGAEEYHRLEDLYTDLVDALQIVLYTKSFKPGLYRKLGEYGIGWEFVEGHDV